MTVLLAVLQLALATFIPIVTAQIQANCTDPGFYWAFNSLQQSPCRVAEDIVSPCSPTGFNVPPLPAGNAYFGPTSDQADACRCSSVFYSLISACGACQDREWVKWSVFTQNCSSVWLTVYANNIPASTKIPHWAYLNVSINGTFDPDVAFADSIDGAPESTRSSAPTRTPASASSSTSTSNSQSNSQSSRHSHAGAIAGGVVGGLAGLVLIAGAAIFYYRRSMTKRRPGSGYEQDMMYAASSTIVTQSPPLPATSPHERVLRPQKLYNPHDPSTFPTRLHTTNLDSLTPSITGSTYTNAPQNALRPVIGAMHYTGAPEVYHS